MLDNPIESGNENASCQEAERRYQPKSRIGGKSGTNDQQPFALFYVAKAVELFVLAEHS